MQSTQLRHSGLSPVCLRPSVIQAAYTQLAPVGGLLLSVSILVAIFEHFNSVPEVPRSAFGEAFICYLIMSIAYSQLYRILNRFLDKSLNVPIPQNETATLLYFSMTTISGVGYGGLLPINPYVRIIASLETMTGIFFVAVVVARLVASYQPASRSQPEHQSAKDAHLTKV
jgi:Ion channel